MFRAAGLEVHRIRTMDRGIALEVDLRQLLPDAKLLFDVGANLGQTTQRLTELFPLATVHAFEPVQATHTRLRANVGHDPRVVVHRCALGEKDGPTQMQILAESGWNRVIAPG